MEEFQTSSDQNTTAANKVITSLATTLQLEKEALFKVRSDLKVDNAEMSASIVSKIEKLMEDLTTENNIMDQLAVKTKKAKVLSVKLSHANKQIGDLNTDNNVLKSCVLDVNQYFQNLVETRDSFLMVSVHQHLADKLKPVFSLLKTLKVF